MSLRITRKPLSERPDNAGANGGTLKRDGSLNKGPAPPMDLPGTPRDDDHERRMDLVRARRDLQAQQRRLENFESLLARVKTECDRHEKTKTVRGFPTPAKLGKKAAVTAFHESTPIEKLTRSNLCETNPMMRTPISVPFSFAWEEDDVELSPTSSDADDPDYLNIRDSEKDEGEADYCEVVDDTEPVYVQVCSSDMKKTMAGKPKAETKPRTLSPGLAEKGDADANKQSDIHTAASQGNTKRVVELMVKGWDVNSTDAFGRTPLMYAMRAGQLATARWLLEHGADINKQTVDKSTALHYTVYQGTANATKFLVDAKANPRITDNEGRTALHWSMHNADVRVLDALLQETLTPADYNARDNAGMTPAMWACFYDSTEHLDRMIELGADLDLEDVDGKKALHWSARSGRVKCLRKMLTYDNSFTMDGQGRSVIHHAAEVGSKKALKLVLSKRPQAIHDVDNNGRAPLHWAAVCKHPYAMLTLVKHGSFVERTDVVGKTARQYALEHGFEEGVTIIDASEKFTRVDVPRLGPANASTSLRSFDLATPQGADSPSEAAQELFKMLSVGSYLHKFACIGKGQLQKRYFWLDCFTGELCWAKSPAHFAKSPNSASSEYMIDIDGSASETIKARADYDPEGSHKYAFTLMTHGRRIDVVAESAEIYKLWNDGMRCLKVYGEHILQSTQQTPAQRAESEE